MSLKIYITFISFFFVISASSYADTDSWVSGQNVLFSPKADEFIYFTYGKTSAGKIWRIFSIKEDRDLNTIIYNLDTNPVWSYSGNAVAYPDKNKIFILSQSAKNEFSCPVNNVGAISFAPDDNRIVYSDSEKIYILQIDSKKNSLLTYGKSPFWSSKGITYSDDNNFIYLYGANGTEKLLLSDIDEYAVSKDSSMIAGIGIEFRGIVLYNIEASATNYIPLTNTIQGYDISPDGRYLVFALDGAGIWLRDMNTALTYKIFQEGIFPKWSYSGNYLTYELKKKIFINNFKDFFSSISVRKTYKLNIGSSAGLKLGDILQVYEEKTNPFSGEVTGYDVNLPKTKMKVISIFKDYSFLDKISADDNTEIEINDAVFSQKLNKFGFIVPYP